MRNGKPIIKHLLNLFCEGRNGNGNGMSDAGSGSERSTSDTASNATDSSDAPEDEGRLAWITRPRGFTKEAPDSAALEAAAAVAAVDAATQEDKDDKEDKEKVDKEKKEKSKELERTVKRAVRGLGSDFGQRRALDTLNGLLAGPEAAAVRALPVLADSAGVAAQLAHNVDVRLETLESLRLVAALAPAPRFAAHFLAAHGAPAVAHAMADADAVRGADGQPVPDGPETLARLGTSVLASLSSTGL